MSNEQDSAIVKVESFGAIESRQQSENAAIVMSARARATIEAMCVLAERHPRDWDVVRVKMLKECKRPGFAEVAIYEVPRGGKTITGFSIRFAEAVLRHVGNMSAGSEVVFEDSEKLIVMVTVRDYESNTAIETQVMVPKTTEKKSLRTGERPISSRKNSYGDTVHLVPATDDDVAMKMNSLVSKAMRNAVLRLLPGDIADECGKLIGETYAKKDAEDPDAARKKVVDSFADQHVMPDQLVLYVGHSLDALSPKELTELRGIWAAIREGEISWAEALAAKTGEVAGTAEEAKVKAAAVEAVLAKAREKGKKPAPAAAVTPQPAPVASPSNDQPRQREPGED
jgi:hypothetical protein